MSIHLKKEHFIGEPSYIIFQSDDGLYYAVNQKTKDVLAKSADPTTVIQQAIDALANGGKILIRQGIYEINAPITLKSYISLIGEGWNTILKPTEGMNEPILTTPDNVDNHHILIADLAISGTGVSNLGSSNEGIVLFRPWLNKIWHVMVRELGGVGIHLRESPHEEIHLNWVTDSYIDWVNGHGIHISSVSDVVVARNEIGRCGQPEWPTRTITDSCGVFLYNSSVVKIFENHIHQSGQANVQVEESEQVLIENNRLEQSSKHNIGSGAMHRSIIQGNKMRNCNMGGATDGSHISLYNCTYNFIVGNKMLDDQPSPTSVYALQEVGETSDYNVVILNDVRENPQGIVLIGTNSIAQNNPGVDL